MYNKNMARRASKHDAPVSKGINKIALGFTIIETMLFLAIAGLIFAGLVAGTNGAIRRQRYKDSVQGFVDDLRDLYSLTENTQVMDYHGPAECGGQLVGEGRGRSSCSVYGILASITSSDSGRDNVEAYWVTGVDQSMIKGKSSDEEFFNAAQIRTWIYVDDERKEMVAKDHSILWGADLRIPCEANQLIDGCNYSGNIRSSGRYQVLVFIYRSPITGSLNTRSLTINNDNSESKFKSYGDNLWANIGAFEHKDVSLCITGGSGMSYDGGIRMVTIDGNGSNSNAVRLIEADSDGNKCN